MSGDQKIDALSALLPFYISGTLSDDDRTRVEIGLRDIPTLYAEMKRELAMVQRIQSAGDSILAEPDNQEDRLDTLLSTLPDQQDAPKSHTQNHENQPARSALAFLSPKFWVPALGMSLAIAIAFQTTILIKKNNQIAELEEKFQSSGGPCADDQQTAGRVIIELKDDAQWRAIAELLDAQQMRIIDSEGFGTLTLTSETAPGELKTQIEALKASPLILAVDLAK